MVLFDFYSTCRPYLIYGIQECVIEAQNGGVGVIVYFRKEGRALGEVTKYLVYNARKRAEGGDTASAYFERTENVAGTFIFHLSFQYILISRCERHAFSITHA